MKKKLLIINNIFIFSIKENIINEKNEKYYPITMEFLKKENPQLTERQKSIIEIFNKHVNINQLGKSSELERYQTNMLFMEFGYLNNFNIIKNRITLILFTLTSIIGNIYFTENKFINYFKENYKTYILYGLWHMLFIYNPKILNYNFSLFIILGALIGSLFELLFVKITEKTLNLIFDFNIPKSEYKKLFFIQLKFFLQLLIYWRFITYPKNNKFVNNYKNKFQKIKDNLIKKEYTSNNSINGLIITENINYIKENDFKKFNEEILSI